MERILIMIFGWTLQILVMMSDIAIIVAVVVIASYAIAMHSLLFAAIAAVSIKLTYETWRSQEGFIAWTHRKQFMENWKKINGVK